MNYGFPTITLSTQAQVNQQSSKRQIEKMIGFIKQSEKKWRNTGKESQSLSLLEKGIQLLSKIISDESSEIKKKQYEKKMEEFKQRLEKRRNGEQKNIQNFYETSFIKKQLIQETPQYIAFMEKCILKPNMKWQDVIGMQEAKDILKEFIILPCKFPALFKNHKDYLQKNILLYGPPGVGKSYLMKACRAEISLNIFSLNCSDLLCNYVNFSERLIKDIFKKARYCFLYLRQNKPSMIFLDQIELLSSKDHIEQLTRIQRELLIQLVGPEYSNSYVYIVSATNEPWKMKQLYFKIFQKKVYLNVPTFEERIQLIKEWLKDKLNCLSEDDFKQISKKTQNYSRSDLQNLMRDVQFQPIRKQFKKERNEKIIIKARKEDNELISPTQNQQVESKQITNENKYLGGKVSMKHFQIHLKTHKSTIQLSQLERYETFTKDQPKQL